MVESTLNQVEFIFSIDIFEVIRNTLKILYILLISLQHLSFDKVCFDLTYNVKVYYNLSFNRKVYDNKAFSWLFTLYTSGNNNTKGK